MNKAIVTGAGGFLGHALTKKLLDSGVTVYGVTTSENKVLDLKMYESFIPIISDFTEYYRLAETIDDNNIDVTFHCAWQGVYGDSFKDYSLQLSNANYACETLVQSKLLNVKKFVLISTCNEFEVESTLNDYDFKPNFTCVYGISKLATDIICKTLACNNGIEYNSGLSCMIYGENNKSKMLPNVILDQLNNGISPNLISGNNLYDLIYVDDVVDALISIGNKGADLKSYYIGHRNLRTFKELLTDIGNFVNPNIKLNFGAYADARNIDYSKINLDELFNDTGFECKCDFKESIINTAEWLKESNI